MSEENNRIVYSEVVDYIRSLVPERSHYFKTLEEYADTYHVPIIETEVAQLLTTLIKIHKPKRILEIGTAIGYSASIMATAMDAGKITSIEIREDMHLRALENVKALDTQVEFDFKLGDGLEVLPTIHDTFDMIFIDASKGHYLEFLELCQQRIRPGGLIVSDNVLYKGMIADQALVLRRKKTIVKRMRHYLQHLFALDTFTSTLIPIGDGVALSYKNGGENESY